MVLGHDFGLELGLVLHLGRGDVIRLVLGPEDRLIPQVGLVDGFVGRRCDVFRNDLSFGDVLRLVSCDVLGLVVSDVFRLSPYDGCAHEFWEVVRLVLGAEDGLVDRFVGRGRDVLMLVDRLVDWNLQ